MVDIIANFGLYAGAYLIVLTWLWALTCIRVQWRCEFCGKINDTGLIKALLSMCDHMGLR